MDYVWFKDLFFSEVTFILHPIYPLKETRFACLLIYSDSCVAVETVSLDIVTIVYVGFFFLFMSAYNYAATTLTISFFSGQFQQTTN